MSSSIWARDESQGLFPAQNLLPAASMHHVVAALKKEIPQFSNKLIDVFVQFRRNIETKQIIIGKRK